MRTGKSWEVNLQPYVDHRNSKLSTGSKAKSLERFWKNIVALSQGYRAEGEISASYSKKLIASAIS